MQNINVEPVLSIDYKTLEEIKKLRTNISFLDAKVFNITSVVGKEGKSMISFWLARTIADTGKKVILVDGNLRSRYKNSILRINKDKNKKSADMNKEESENILGLSEYLDERAKMEDIICESNLGMDFIISGEVPNNPSELLSHTSVAELFSYLRERYDYVIIDTPSAGEVTDATILAKYSDGCILVVEPNVTDAKLAMKVKEQIENSGAKILGAVINKA